MKRTLCICAAFLLLVRGAFALNEKVVVWEQIYRDVSTDQQRIAVLLKIMELKDRDFTPLLVSALDQLVKRNLETGSPTERAQKNQLARLLVQELGNLKSAEAAETVFRIYAETAEPLLRGESAVALGKMRATEYAPRLARDLASINLAPQSSASRSQEIIALGTVQGLNLMRAGEGYEPVFLASFGWYSASSRVRETARAASLTMVDDPADSLLSILAGNPDLGIKQAALDTVIASRATDDRKATVAARALRIGIERAASDAETRAATAKIRVTALTALAALRDHNQDNVELFTQVIRMDRKNDATLEETLKAYVALGVNGTDPAARFLAAKLLEYNGYEKSKANTPRDKSLIRQIIASMMLAKNPVVKNALVQAQFIDYDSNILRLVKDALSNIPD